MAKGILVFIEQRNGQLRKASLEALSQAAHQAKADNLNVYAMLAGENIKHLAAELGKYGANKIFVADNSQFAQYATEIYAAALSEAIKVTDPAYVFSAHTAMSKDLIPRVAARFDASCVSDVIELRTENGQLLAVKTMYSSKTYALFEFNTPLVFLTLRPNAFPASTDNAVAAPEIIDLTVAVEKVRAKVVETHAAAGQKIELSEASIVVSGGRGIKGPENWGVLQDLCDVLGAALGASRAVVDAGWIDHQHQVGQTGKTVSPQVYIACGISGAIQHLAGMSSSKVIIAINKDENAPIFKLATYGIVGDVLEIVPKITQEIRKLQENG